MKKKILFILLIIGCWAINAQKIEGKWISYDDKTYEKRGLIEIYKHKKKYYGKIIGSFKDPKRICDKCSGDKKNKPMVGMVIIEGLVKDGKEYNGGTILDPENGNVYDCYIKLIGKDKLKVKGFLGISLLGRAQYWKRAD